MLCKQNRRGSVIIVAVAVLLLLSLLAVTYITVMEIEVSSNETFQFGIKADMVVNWFISDACALIQSTVRNVGIYEDRALADARAVWHGVDYTSGVSVKAKFQPMNWNAVPHNWYSPPLADFRRYDFDCYSMNTSEGNTFGYISPEGNIFGEKDSNIWWSYQAHDIDLLNIDGDFDSSTHRQAKWRTYRSPDPRAGDSWDTVYARSAGLVVSTQKMLYLGEFRGDFSRRDGAYAGAGHQRSLGTSPRPLGYNLACYKADPSDPVHQGMERVDRDKLSPVPGFGAGNINGAVIRRAGDDMPDISAWNGGEGMMNINALIRILTHLVNEEAAVAIAKHRPYRTKQHILQAVDAEGAALTTTEYARLMANVTCHANYDPITGFCPLNINKLRAPQSLCPAWCVGPDPLLEASYDRDMSNYMPDGGRRYRYKQMTFQEYIRMDAPVPSKMKVSGELSFWDYKKQWDRSHNYRQALWDVLHPSSVDQGDFDPSTGDYFERAKHGVRITNRLLWGVFSCIPSLVITSQTGGSRHTTMEFDEDWRQMAVYAQNEYTQAIGYAPTTNSGTIRNDFTPSDVLQTVIGLIQMATAGKVKHVGRNAFQAGTGARAWVNDVHPVNMVFNNGSTGYAPGVGRAIPNEVDGSSNRGFQGMVLGGTPGGSNRRWGWSPVQQGSSEFLSEMYNSDGSPVGDPAGTNAMGFQWRAHQGRFIEDMDRFEEIIAWMAPFHPVANPHGRGIITERQANDILNNFIDFRDNVKDPNNLLTDWKLHSQEYDRGSYEAYKTNVIHKDGYLDNARMNTVCSMGNYAAYTPSECRFPDSTGPNPGAGTKAKVPYVYIRRPYFNEAAYQRNQALDREDPATNPAEYTGIPYFGANGLEWTDRLGLIKGESIIEMNLNVHTSDDPSMPKIASVVGYGDPGIVQRLVNRDDNLYPWVNELEHQEYNIIGMGSGQQGTTFKNVCWVRNHGFASLNWTKDWVAFNYHRNHHKRDEFRRLVADGGLADAPHPHYPEHAGFIAEGYYEDDLGKEGTTWFTNPDFGPDTGPPSNDPVKNDLSKGKVDDNGNCEKVFKYWYYESPGLVSGPDRIPDVYQTLNKGHVLTDLSRYYQVEVKRARHEHTEDANGNNILDPGEDTHIVNGVIDTWVTFTYSPHYSRSVGVTRRYTDLRDSNNDWIPDNGSQSITDQPLCFSNGNISGFDRAFRQFLYNCTEKVKDVIDERIYGYEATDPGNTDCSYMDADCRLKTFFGYRGSEVYENVTPQEGNRPRNFGGHGWGNETGGDYSTMGRVDLKTDSPYFHGTSVRGRQTRASSHSTFLPLVTLYNKPYLYDLPMRSPAKSGAGGMTFGYSYNYGRNIYAYDFDGNALAIKNGSPHMADKDTLCPSMFRMAGNSDIDVSDGGGGTEVKKGIRLERVQYGEMGCVAGSGGRVDLRAFGAPKDGYHLPSAAVSAGKGDMHDIVPRFNPVEPFFDPMYPNGRLFYRRLMTCGDTTIVLDSNYKNVPSAAGYNPMKVSTYNVNNIYKTVQSRHVKYENNKAVNPFITDCAATHSHSDGAETYTAESETWPAGTAAPGHWNHVYNADYSVPAGAHPGVRCCADTAWSIPLTTRDRFYEIHVRADIVNTGFSALGMYKAAAGEKWVGWRGQAILASKQAVAVFDRGWRWAYWDDDAGLNQACPWYDPFRMVGSRPGLDTASDSNHSAAYPGMIYDNEMCTVDDWKVDSVSKTAAYDRTYNVNSQVRAGYIAPAEYSGVNRPGDDCAERARIVFFRWTGITQ